VVPEQLEMLPSGRSSSPLDDFGLCLVLACSLSLTGRAYAPQAYPASDANVFDDAAIDHVASKAKLQGGGCLFGFAKIDGVFPRRAPDFRNHPASGKMRRFGEYSRFQGL